MTFTLGRDDLVLQILSYCFKCIKALYLKHMAFWGRRCNGVQFLFCMRFSKYIPDLRKLRANV